MTQLPASPAMHELGAFIRAWAHIAVIVLGGLSAWFSLSAKVQRLEERHAEWREAQTSAMVKLSRMMEEQARETRAHAVDLAILRTGNDDIRSQLRRLDQRAERTERPGAQPVVREVQ